MRRPPTAVFVTDDHTLIRETIVEHLNREHDIRVVGSANNTAQAVEGCCATKPDVLLMDIDLGGESGLEAAQHVLRYLPLIRLIFISAYIYDRHVQGALKLKAGGFVSKKEGPDGLVRAIRCVSAGQEYYSHEAVSRMAKGRNGKGFLDPKVSRAATLTDREIQVVRHVAQGCSKKEVAELLSICTKTVDRHCAKAMAKLDIHDRVELALFAFREGLVTLEV